MVIKVNPKNIANLIGDGTLKQWHTQKTQNMPIHYQLALAPHEISAFLEETIQNIWSLESIKYEEQNSEGFKFKYTDKIIRTDYVDIPVVGHMADQYVNEFVSMVHYGCIHGDTTFLAAADVYVSLPTKSKSKIEKRIHLHGRYLNMHNRLHKIEYQKGMSEYWHIRRLHMNLVQTYYPDDHQIANELKRNGGVFLKDGKTRLTSEGYNWEKDIYNWRKKQLGY